MTGSSPAGFPHSDINGSVPACGSPLLFAACHVLHRRMVPGHPPCALCSLIFSSINPETNWKFHFFYHSSFLLLQLASLESFLLCSCQGALSCAVRETGIPSAVRARFLMPAAARALKTIQSSSRVGSFSLFLFERSLTFRFASLKLFNRLPATSH